MLAESKNSTFEYNLEESKPSSFAFLEMGKHFQESASFVFWAFFSMINFLSIPFSIFLHGIDKLTISGKIKLVFFLNR